MKATDLPALVGTPFAKNGIKTAISQNTSPGTNAASYNDGFPEITMTELNNGGLPPRGSDFNQILYELARSAQWAGTGSLYKFSADFSTKIGGYPKGSKVIGSDGIVYECLNDDNMNDPVGGAGWVNKGEDKNTRELWRRSLAEIGLTLVDGSFQKGATVNSATDAVWDIDGAQCYTWTGDFPHTSEGETGAGWVSVGDFSLRDELTSGAVIVGNSLIVFNTVSDLIASDKLIDGCKVRTYKHNVPVTSDWIFSHEKPHDDVFNLVTKNGYITLLTPDFASAGIKDGDFNANDAWHNRNVMHKLLKDVRFNSFSVGAVGKFYVLGTIHPNRSDILVKIESGSKIIGRYDDVSIPDSTSSQTGEMFGFTIRGGYDNGDFTTTGTVRNVTLEILGEISTEYSESHSRKNNNNAVGLLRSENCHVIGTGGIGESDHKGVCFDGEAVNCHVYLGYVKRTMNEPVQIKGAYLSGIRNLCSVKVGDIEPVFGGANPPVSVYVSGCNFDVEIGSLNYFGSLLPVVVGAFGAQEVRVTFGYVGRASQVVRQYNTESVIINGGKVSAVQNIVTRGGDGSVTPRQTIISNILANDNVLTSAYREDSSFTTGNRFLTVSDCDFTPASTAFKYLDTTSNPTRKSIYNNISRQGMVITEYNPVIGIASRNVITDGARSFNYDAANPDFNFSSVNLLVRNSSGAIYSLDVNIKARLDSGVSGATFNVGGVIVDTELNGLVMRVSTSTGGANFVSCVPFN